MKNKNKDILQIENLEDLFIILKNNTEKIKKIGDMINNVIKEKDAEIIEANSNAYWWKCRYDAQVKINKEREKIMKKCSKKLNNDLIKLGRVTNSNAIYVRNELSHEYKIVVKKK